MYAEADKLLARLNLYSSHRLVAELLHRRSADGGNRQGAQFLSQKSSLWMNRQMPPTDTETESLFSVIRELREQGCGIVLYIPPSERDFEICDDVTVFRDDSLSVKTGV